MRLFIFIIGLSTIVSCFALTEENKLEISNASEGAPPHITKEATFLKFEDGHFVEIKSGKNNFTCLVVHEPKGRYEPSCFNQQARRSILPAYEMHMRLLYQGKSYAETYSALEKAFDKGKLPTAETGSLVYMMSPNNKIYNQDEAELVASPIHHMYFYPKLADEIFSLGESPVFLWQGFPHLSALIVTVPAVNSHNKANHGAH